MTAIHIVLFVSTSCCLGLCPVITAEDDIKSGFVNGLKFDLRRNNDDYVEITTGIINMTNPYLQTATSTPVSVKSDPTNDSKQGRTLAESGKFSFRRGPPQINNLLPENEKETMAHRRQFDYPEMKDSFSKEVPRSNNSASFIITPATRDETPVKTRPSTMKILTTLKKVFPNYSPVRVMKAKTSTTKEDAKKIKMDKFKSFLAKNKELFSEFMMKKKAELEGATQRAPDGLVQILRDALPVIARDRTHQDEAALQEDLLFRARPHAPMTADQLDMAPARGGRIHALRLKGRLCQRNILVPEGPKYNSKGSVYVQAYGHRKGRDYGRTAGPKLLLPRCCNCCKKSVLGCE